MFSIAKDNNNLLYYIVTFWKSEYCLLINRLLIKETCICEWSLHQICCLPDDISDHSLKFLPVKYNYFGWTAKISPREIQFFSINRENFSPRNVFFSTGATREIRENLFPRKFIPAKIYPFKVYTEFNSVIFTRKGVVSPYSFYLMF